MQEIHEKISVLSVEVGTMQNAVDGLRVKRAELEENLKLSKGFILEAKNSEIIDLPDFRQLIENRNHCNNLLDACKQAQATYSSALKAKRNALSVLKEKYLACDTQVSKGTENVIKFRGHDGKSS